MANPCYLVVHPKGMLIWDCGFEDSLADLPAGYNSGRSIWSLPKKLAQQLSEMGVDPKDIDYFTLSHSHHDHSWHANLFKTTTWIVDEAERDFMFRKEDRPHKEFKNYKSLEQATLHPFPTAPDLFG